MAQAKVPRLIDVVGTMRDMDDAGILQQPPDVWLRVEGMIGHHWHFASSAAVAAVDGPQATPPKPGAGWLNWTHFEGLAARNVPFRKMFTLAALEQRRGRG